MPDSIHGVGPDTPPVLNERGAAQSDVPFRFDLVDPHAMFEMCRILYKGAIKYGEGNWRGVPVNEHLNHLIMHAYAYLAGDTSEPHLAHVLCRAVFAAGVDGQGGPVEVELSLVARPQEPEPDPGFTVQR